MAINYIHSMKMIVVVIALISFSSTIAQDIPAFEKRVYVEGKDTLRYRILFPENYDRAKHYPVVLFLHGAGERGNDNIKQLTHGMNLFADPANRSKYPVIVIAPQCPENQSWNSMKANRDVMPIAREFNYKAPIPRPLELAINLTKRVVKEEKANKKMVFISGLSMGGMGTFEAVGRFPKMFKAAAPICGGGDKSYYSKSQAKVAFWIFHGDADKTVDVKYSREMYARLQELKANVKYTEYPGVGHNSWTNAFAEPEFLPWLLNRK